MIHINSDSAKRMALEELSRLRPDGKWVIAIAPFESRRTLPQNSRYWAILSLIADEIGESKGYIHDLLKMRMFGLHQRRVDGKVLTELKSSADLTKEDFTKLMQGAELLAHEMSVQVPFSNLKGE